jgi:hypothetical protein
MFRLCGGMKSRKEADEEENDGVDDCNLKKACKKSRAAYMERTVPEKVTFTGTGAVGGLGLAQVCDADLFDDLVIMLEHDASQEVKLWRKAQLVSGTAKEEKVGQEAGFALNVLAELSKAVKSAAPKDKARIFAVHISKVPLDIVPCAAEYAAAGQPKVFQVLLDSGENGKLRDGVGLRRAIGEEMKCLATEWKWMKFKLQEVMNCAVADIIPILEKGGNDAKKLLTALGSTRGVFPNTTDQRNLEHVLSQLGQRLQEPHGDFARQKEWETTWKPFTSLVEKAMKELIFAEDVMDEFFVTGQLPSPDAGRVYSFLRKGLESEKFVLPTNLSSTFLVANVPEVQASMNNLFDTEAKDYRAIVRVLLARSALVEVNGKRVCELLPKATMKELVHRYVPLYFDTGEGVQHNGVGWLWRPDKDNHGYKMFGGGFIRTNQEDERGAGDEGVDVSRNFGLRARNVDKRISVGELFEAEDEEQFDGNDDDGEFEVAPKVERGSGDLYPMDQWGHLCASGEWDFFPSVVLVGFGNDAAGMTFDEVCKWKGRLIVIENATAGDVDDHETVLKPFLFDPFSDAGEIFRGWIRRVQKHWRKFMFVCTTPEWTVRIVKQIGGKKDVVRLPLAQGVVDGCLPDPRWVLQQAEEVVASAVKHSFDLANRLVGGKGLLREQDEEAEDDLKKVPATKMSLVDFYHEWMKPLYLLPVSNDALEDIDESNKKGKSGIDGMGRRFYKPSNAENVLLECPDRWHVYGRGHGTVSTEGSEKEFEVAALDFLSNRKASEEWFNNVARGIGSSVTTKGLFDVLAKCGAPIALTRTWHSSSVVDKAVLHIGQVYWDGFNFANTKGGCSPVVRLSSRAAGLSDDRQFFCCDALPCNSPVFAMFVDNGCSGGSGGDTLPMDIFDEGEENHQQSQSQEMSIDSDEEAASSEDESSEGHESERLAALAKVEDDREKMARYQEMMRFFGVILLSHMKLAMLAAEKVFLSPWGNDAERLAAFCLQHGRESTGWLFVKDGALVLPDQEVPHPNLVARARTVNTVYKIRKQVVERTNEMSVFFIGKKLANEKSFVQNLITVHSGYDPKRVRDGNAAALQLVRPIVDAEVHRLAAKLTELLQLKKEERPPVWKRHARVILQLLLNEWSLDTEFVRQIHALQSIAYEPMLKKKPPEDPVQPPPSDDDEGLFLLLRACEKYARWMLENVEKMSVSEAKDIIASFGNDIRETWKANGRPLWHAPQDLFLAWRNAWGSPDKPLWYMFDDWKRFLLDRFTALPERANHLVLVQLSKSKREKFLRRCYDFAHSMLSQESVGRAAWLDKLHINTSHMHWKMEFCDKFRFDVKQLLSAIKCRGDWIMEWLLATQTDIEAIWLSYRWQNESDSLCLSCDILGRYVGRSGLGSMDLGGGVGGNETAAPQKFGYKKDNFFFVPKVPIVKRIPETGFTTGFCLLSNPVCQELLALAARKVIARENMMLLLEQIDTNLLLEQVFDNCFDLPWGESAELFFQKTAKLVLRASVCASLRVQKRKLVGGDMMALDEMMRHILGDSSVGPPKKRDKWGDAATRALFDYARVFPQSFRGSVSARSDGYGVHLFGESFTKKAKVRACEVAQNPARSASQEVPFVATSRKIGLDEGKGSSVGICHPKKVDDHIVRLAQAEAELAAAEEALQAASKNVATAKDLFDAVPGPKQNGLWRSSDCNEYVRTYFAHSSAQSKYDACVLDVHRAKDGVTNATCDAEIVDELLVSDRRKGIRCVTKEQKAAEFHEKQEALVREERLRIFNECLSPAAGTVQQLQSNRKPLHGVKGIRSLGLTWLLHVAHNSSAVRHQRRARDKMERSYSARYARLVTLDLPSAVDASGGQFLQKGLHFPARGPQSRAREVQRGWERGTHEPQPKVATEYGPGEAPSERYPHITVFVDRCPTKGQKTTSTFAFAGNFYRLCKQIKSRRLLAQRVTVQVVNGNRTSRQAAGVRSFLTHSERQSNHRRVKPTDMHSKWEGPIVSQFYHVVCPITGQIMCRDPPSCSNVIIVGSCAGLNAPRPHIYTSTHG